MIKKKQQASESPDKKITVNKNTFIRKTIGLALLVISASVFIQGIPLMFVFIGAYLGVPADATIGNMDTMIWLLTCVTMMVLVLYAFLTWMKCLWRQFMAKPNIAPPPLPLPIKKKEKHAR
jgi:hypothetical protein